jgi:hypothetical protein
MRKKVDGEVAYGDSWPRKAETLFCLLRFMMPTGTMGWLEMDRVRGESASDEGREPNCKLRSSNASMDVKRKETRSRGAAHTPEVRSGRSRVGVGGWAFDNRTDNSSSFRV